MKIIGILAPLVISLALVFLVSKQVIKHACESGSSYVGKTTCEENGFKKRSLISSNWSKTDEGEKKLWMVK